MGRTKSDFDTLREDLRKVYYGDPWHGSSITDVLKGVDADTAGLKSVPHGHTIWEIVLHMTGWTREVTSRVRGAAPKSPPKDWPTPRRGRDRDKINSTGGKTISTRSVSNCHPLENARAVDLPSPF
jgi:hypothetical protein